MKRSKTLVLLFVVLGLGGYIWFFEIHQTSTHQQKALDRQAFDLPIEQIQSIGIRNRTYEISLFRTNTGWELLHPKGARANLPIVQQVLARIKNLGRGDFITPADMRERELTLTDFGLAVPQLILSLETSNQKRVYKVGDPNPLGNSVYVKEESSQNVMLVSTDLLDILPKEVAAFRETSLFPLNFPEVGAFDLVSDDRTLRVEKNEGNWSIIDPLNAVGDQQKVSELLQKLLQSRIDGVVNDPSAEEVENFNRSEHIVRIWNSNSKVPMEITVGGDVPGDPDSCYVRITGQEGLVIVSKGMRHLAQTPTFSLRDRRLFTVDPQTVNLIRIERDGRQIRLEKNALGWQVVDPVSLRASGARVQTMIQTWMDSRVEAFKEGNENAVVGSTVEFGYGTAGKSIQFEVIEDGVEPGRALLRKNGEAGFLQVVPDLVRYSPVDVLPYLSRQVLSFDPTLAVRLSITRGETSTVVSRETPEQAWVSTEQDVVVNQKDIQAVLDAFSSMFAESLVELNPKDLSKYGLDQPMIRLSIGLGGDQPSNRTVLLKMNAENEFAYGLVQGQPLVFRHIFPGLQLLQDLKPLTK